MDTKEPLVFNARHCHFKHSHGPEGARAKCCGPALAAVERVISRMEAAEEERQFAHAEAEIQTGGF